MQLVFATYENGFYQRSLHECCKDQGPLVFFVRDLKGNDFGFFLSRSPQSPREAMKSQKLAFQWRDMQAFVFRLAPGEPKVWMVNENGQDDEGLFVYFSAERIAISAAGQAAIVLGTDLKMCSTAPCDALNSAILTTGEQGRVSDEFEVKTLEVWKFVKDVEF